MLTMTSSDVRLGTIVNSKEDAIRAAADLLIESDSIARNTSTAC